MAAIPDDVVPPQPPGYEEGCDWPGNAENDIPDRLPMPLIELHDEYISSRENHASHLSERAHIYDLPGLVKELEDHGAVCPRDGEIAAAASD